MLYVIHGAANGISWACLLARLKYQAWYGLAAIHQVYVLPRGREGLGMHGGWGEAEGGPFSLTEGG